MTETFHSESPPLGYRILPLDWKVIYATESSTIALGPHPDDLSVSRFAVVVNAGNKEIKFSALSYSLPPLHYFVGNAEFPILELDGPGDLLIVDFASLPQLSGQLKKATTVFPLPTAAFSLVESLINDHSDVPHSSLVRALAELLGPNLQVEIEDEEIERFRNFVAQHLSEQISTEDIASAMGVSVDHLRDATRETLGLTPASYLREARMLLARDFLTSTSVSIEQIAKHTGYSDRFAFTRAFTTVTGTSPNAYRESIVSKAGQH